MEDLMAQLQNMLSTPQGQEQLKSLAGMLGVNGNNSNESQKANQNNNMFSSTAQQKSGNDAESQQSSGGFDISSLASIFSGLNNNQNENNVNNTQKSGLPNIDMGMLLKAQQAFSSMNTNDSDSQLLLSLKPHFSDKRQKKVDQAINIMRMMKMLPMLTQSGLFGTNK